MSEKLQPTVLAFAGRVGGNQSFVLDRNDPDNKSILEETPDAAPEIPWRQLVDLRGFRNVIIWKQAVLEGIGTFTLVYATGLMGISPNVSAPPPSSAAGVFGTAAFFGPLIGGITTVFYIWIAILAFGPVTGGHLNCFLTIATFMIRITSLPRAVLYVSFQLVGAALAGLMLRATYGTRDFKVGGCFLFEDEGATVGGALATEFAGCFTTIILAFGVAIDPRNKAALGPVLAPFLVGLIVGLLVFGLSFGVHGYGGPSMNPARCFGAYVGSRFPGWHWVHWVGPILASLAHALMYKILPPWELRGKMDEVEHTTSKRDPSKVGDDPNRTDHYVPGGTLLSAEKSHEISRV